MPLNRYGHAGLPIVVFPVRTHNEYADFGMIDACRDSIEAGRVNFTLASVDSESWLADWKYPRDRAEMRGLMSVMSLASYSFY